MKNSDKIKNIIFDLGNVVIDIDLNITVQRFKEMGWKGDENFLDKYKQAAFFGQYEQGAISTQEFVDTIKNLTTVNNSDQEILAAWNALFFKFR